MQQSLDFLPGGLQLPGSSKHLLSIRFPPRIVFLLFQFQRIQENVFWSAVVEWIPLDSGICSQLEACLAPPMCSGGEQLAASGTSAVHIFRQNPVTPHLNWRENRPPCYWSPDSWPIAPPPTPVISGTLFLLVHQFLVDAHHTPRQHKKKITLV